MTGPEPAAPAAATGEPLIDYLLANQDRYTRDVLSKQLAEAGYSAEDVAAAWAWIDAESTAADKASTEPPRRIRQTALTTVAGLIALATFIIGEFALVAVSAGRPVVLLYAVLFPIQIFLVTRWIVRRINASGSLRAGDAAATLGWFVLPFLSMLVLMGVCYGYGAAFGCILEC